MKQLSLVILAIFAVVIFPINAKAATGWITEIYNTSSYEYNIKTNDVKAHRGKVHKGSFHCGKETKTYSNYKNGRYRICKNDELSLSKMGIPWYDKMLRIWNKSKWGDDTPRGKNKSLHVYISSCKSDGNKDCLHITDGIGEDIDSKNELVMGKKGVGTSYSFKLTFTKDNSIRFDVVNKGGISQSFVADIAKWVDKPENKKLIAQILISEGEK